MMISSPFKVLIIDDEKGVVQLCQRLLERRGFQVLTALTPQAGLEILNQEVMDLLLLDIRMPVMDGFQIMELARQKQPYLAILMITGHGTIELAIKALQGGADGLALKPFTAEELNQSVQQAIEQNQLKREMSRLHTLQPLFEFSTQLFSELTPSRLRRLVVESICKHLSCSAAVMLKLSTNKKPAQARLIQLVHKQIFYQAVPPTAESEREIVQTLTQMVARSIQSQEAERICLPSGHCDRFLMVAPSSLHVPTQATDHSNLMGELTPMRRSGDAQNWLILAALRDGSSNETSTVQFPPEQAFTNADLELLSILSNQTATALENALLNSELRSYIRKLKESQRLLLQAEKMAAAGRLMASIAHEINNPLQAVQNCIHLAHRSELSPESRQDYLGMAQTELERLTKTVQRMLDFYRPSPTDRQPTDVNLVLKRVIALMSQKLEDNHIEVVLRSAPDLPSVSTVTDQIQQVFLNLILNASEAMPGGGKLEISTMAIPEKWIEIIIQDNGAGIHPKIRKRIFEPFASAKAGGIGLGLSISYGIITAHGGSLELVESQKQTTELIEPPVYLQGACFRIRLPL